MDRIFSARLDESVLSEMDRVTRRHRMTKKRFIEEAIRLQARRLGESDSTDVWDETLGAWKRGESPGTTLKRARTAFRRSMERHARG